MRCGPIYTRQRCVHVPFSTKRVCCYAFRDISIHISRAIRSMQHTYCVWRHRFVNSLENSSWKTVYETQTVLIHKQHQRVYCVIHPERSSWFYETQYWHTDFGGNFSTGIGQRINTVPHRIARQSNTTHNKVKTKTKQKAKQTFACINKSNSNTKLECILWEKVVKS